MTHESREALEWLDAEIAYQREREAAQTYEEKFKHHYCANKLKDVRNILSSSTPPAGEVEAPWSEALRYVDEDIAIHREWLDFMQNDPAAPSVDQRLGDKDHHREWIRRLNVVRAALTRGDKR